MSDEITLRGRTPAELSASLRALLRGYDDARILADDESERFPEDVIAALDRAGTAAFYVPSDLGGRFERLDAVLALARCVAGRDLSLAIAHGKTFLGSAPIWIGGDPRQRREVAERVLRGEPVSLALTEPDHGTDLVGMRSRAIRREGGYLLRGTKWLINNARRARLFTVLARTADAPSPAALSVFVVPADPARGVLATAKIPTLGVRSADISGVVLDDVAVPESARVGSEGAGLEIVLRALQLTRALCAGLSLGALDRGLEEVLSFASSRALYGGRAIDLPLVRDQLAEVAARRHGATRVAEVAARIAHLRPEHASVASAVAKALVPTWSAAALDELAVVLGARHFVRDPREHGMFQKTLRDHRLVGLFDGSTVVNLAALGAQLPSLLAAEAQPAPAEAFGEGPLPPLAFERLRVTSRHPDGVIAAGRAAEDFAAPALGVAVDALRVRVEQVRAREGARFARAPETFRLARRYAELWAVAAMLASEARTPLARASTTRIASAILDLPVEDDVTEPILDALTTPGALGHEGA